MSANYRSEKLIQLVLAKTELSFTLQWTAATFSGFLLSLLFIEIGEKSDMGVLQAVVGGLAVAVSQSLVLRHHTLSFKWVLSTVLGWAVITAIGIGALGWMVPTTQQLPLRIFSGLIAGATGGFGLGFAQWLAIYKLAPSAWRWIFISAVSWTVAVPVGSVIGSILRQLTQLYLGEIVGLAITWLLVAVLTGMKADKLLPR
ncbi:hypothetical protein [Fortiea contorta]|uniref:hypothetical protein n=1 Tax=Fortiea contorta TaxID=1892405 RepID=UPI00037699B6|nr:hypothetical protein [Fortiea contorta]